MNVNVEWKVKGLFKADAQKCYEEIGKDGKSTREILEIARKPETELHKCFEWDDSIAGEKYRLQQAGDLCRNLVIIPVKIITEKRPENERGYEPTRVFQVKSGGNGEYRSNQFFIDNEDEYQKLLKRARMELESFQKRYKEVAELDMVNDAIEMFLAS